MTDPTSTEATAENRPVEASSDKEPKSGAEDATTATIAEDTTPEIPNTENGGFAAPVVSASKRSRPVYKYDPKKITLRFLFANRDGLTVTVECKPADTVGEVKGALLSVWPEDLPGCSGSDRLRLICMGRGMLSPDARTLEDCQVPVFKTHPTPVNVSVRPESLEVGSSKGGVSDSKPGRGSNNTGSAVSTARPTSGTSTETDQGCACTIM